MNAEENFVDKLYKFYPIRDAGNPSLYNENLIKTIQSNYVWFSKAVKFNDPYDCYRELISYSGSNHSSTREEFLQMVNSDKALSRAERRAAKRKIDDPKKFLGAYEATLQPIINSQGICCFTKKRCSNLMWSHYADCHKGLCLEFDYIPLRQLFDIHKVEYKEGFIPAQYFEDKEKSLVSLFTTKSIEWKYEDEYRAIKEKDGIGHFNKSSLTRVIFGCRTDEIDIKYIKNCLVSSGYKNVQLEKAVMKPKSFNLGFVDL